MAIHDMGGFRSRFTEVFMKQAEKVYVNTAEQIIIDVVQETNVDTGGLKGNWVAGVGDVQAEFSKSKTDPSGQSTISEAKERIKGAKVKDKIVVYNPTPYAGFVENGTIKADAQNFTRNGIRKAKNKSENK